MAQENFKRMMELIDETFATRKDPQQLQVSNAQLKKLQAIHPSTLSELANEKGPLIWVLIIPTNGVVRDQFISGAIGETQLLEKTQAGDVYDSIYLCSVTALPEARGKGQSFKLCLEAIRSVMETHPIKSLFVWPFSNEGLKLSERIAQTLELPLFKRKGH